LREVPLGAVAGLINRYSVSDRSGLVPNTDGSVDIYIQNAAPAGHESNWLPFVGGTRLTTMQASPIVHGARHGKINPNGNGNATGNGTSMGMGQGQTVTPQQP